MNKDFLMDTTAEYQLLGKLLVYSKNADNLPALDSSMFVIPQVHAAIDAVINLHDSGKKPTIGEIKNFLNWDNQHDGIFEKALSFIANSADDVTVYADRVIEYSTRRKLYWLGGNIREMILDGQKSDSVASVIVEELAKETALESKNAERTLTDALEYSIDRLRNPKMETQREFVRTGIAAIDEMTGGFARGLLTIVAAPPSMGKTAFFVNCIANIANAGGRVYSANLEDLNLYVANRMIARFGDIDAQRVTINTGLSFDEIQRAEEAVKRMKSDNVILNDRPGQTSSLIKRAVARMRANGGCDILFCDHLGELASSADAYASTNENTKAMRDIAKEFDIAVVLASQLNRARDPRHEQQMPTIDRLRDSGRIAEFARAIWFLHRPARYSDTADPTQLIVNIAKSSHGRTGDIDVKIDLAKMAIE